MILQNHRFLLCNASKCGQFRVNLVESLEKVGLRHSMGSKNTFLTQSSRKSSGDIIIVSKYSNCQVLSPKKCKPNVPFPNGSADVQCFVIPFQGPRCHFHVQVHALAELPSTNRPKKVGDGEPYKTKRWEIPFLPKNHGSPKMGPSNRIVTFQIQPFSTSMIMGGRVILCECCRLGGEGSKTGSKTNFSPPFSLEWDWPLCARWVSSVFCEDCPKWCTWQRSCQETYPISKKKSQAVHLFQKIKKLKKKKTGRRDHRAKWKVLKLS